MRSPKTTAQLIYCKTRTDSTYKLRVQDFATGKNFSSNQYPKQRVLLFFRESYLQKAIVNVFPVFAWADINTLGAGRNLDSHKPSTSSRICITALNSSNPSSVYIRLCKQDKRFLLLKYCFLKTIFQLAIPAFLSRNIVLNIVHFFLTCNVLCNA